MPTPKKLAVLISLLGLGLPCSTSAASGDESAVWPDQPGAPGMPATEAAIRGALTLPEAPTPPVTKSAWPPNNGNNSRDVPAPAQEPRPNEPGWTKRALGLENTVLRSVIIAAEAARAARKNQIVNENPTAKPEEQEELLGEIQLALGLKGKSLQRKARSGQTTAPALARAVQADPPVAPDAPTVVTQNSAPDAPEAPDAPSDASFPAAVPVREPLQQPLTAQPTALPLDEGPAPDEPAPPDGSDRSKPTLATDPHNGIRRTEKVPATYSLVTATPEEDPVIAQAPITAGARPEESAGGVAAAIAAEHPQREESETGNIASTFASIEDAERDSSVHLLSPIPQPARDGAESTIRAELIEAPPSQTTLLAASHNLQLARQILLPLIKLEGPGPAPLASLEAPIILAPPSNVALQIVDLPIARGETSLAQFDHVDALPIAPFASDLEPAAEPTRAEPAAAIAAAPVPARQADRNKPAGQQDDWRPTIIERAIASAAQRKEPDAVRQAVLPQLFQAEGKTSSETQAALANPDVPSAAIESADQQPGAAAAHALAESAATPAEVVESGKSKPATTSEPQPATGAQQSTLDALDSALPETEKDLEEDLPYAANPDAAADSGVNPMQGDFLVANDNQLDEVRGGFTTDNGLQISFGIERAVRINGNLIATTSLNVSDLSKLSAGQAGPGGLAPGSLGLIQIGPGNTFQPGTLSPSSVASVIQNTLNNQKIQNVTTISATVNSLEVLKGLSLQSSLRNAITDSLRH